MFIEIQNNKLYVLHRNHNGAKDRVAEIINLTKDEAKAKFGQAIIELDRELNGVPNASAKRRFEIINLLGEYSAIQFTPDFSKIQADNPSEYERKILVEHLKQYFEFTGITQQELAELTGLHQSNISRVLSGKYSPELDTFLKIASALNLRIEIKVKA